jgi:hypothetical protein
LIFDKCQKCGRKLKNPDSMKRGFGSSCAKQLGIVKIQKPKKVKINNNKTIFDFEVK